jgi:nucleoside 2-deoxyribosyltransferase
LPRTFLTDRLQGSEARTDADGQPAGCGANARSALPDAPHVERRVYLAGFDVFRQDAANYGRTLKALCVTFGLRGVYPLDSAVPAELSLSEPAEWIYRANIASIRACDLVMANVDDFREPGEVDSGAAFETGFAAALGKPVWAYTRNTSTPVERVPHIPSAAGTVCERGFLVEDFGLSKNLMIACSATIIHGDARAGLEAIVSSMSGTGTPSPCRLGGESEIRQMG